MNFPTGVAKISGRNTQAYDASRELENLASSGFSGYVIESLLGEKGLEESALLFRSGQVIGGVYEYYGLNATLQGDEAIAHVLNAFAAEHGVVDVMELSTQQADLVVAFNAKLKLPKPLVKGQLRGMIKDSFDSTLVQKVSKAVQPEAVQTKESLFKKFGLAGIEGK